MFRLPVRISRQFHLSFSLATVVPRWSVWLVIVKAEIYLITLIVYSVDYQATNSCLLPTLSSIDVRLYTSSALSPASIPLCIDEFHVCLKEFPKPVHTSSGTIISTTCTAIPVLDRALLKPPSTDPIHLVIITNACPSRFPAAAGTWFPRTFTVDRQFRFFG